MVVVVLHSVLFWFLSTLLGYLALIVTSLITGQSAVNYPATVFSAHLPATLATFVFWIAYIPLVFRGTRKFRHMMSSEPNPTALTFLLTYMALDFLLFGVFLNRIAMVYYGFLAPWFGYIFLYFLARVTKAKYQP